MVVLCNINYSFCKQLGLRMLFSRPLLMLVTYLQLFFPQHLH